MSSTDKQVSGCMSALYMDARRACGEAQRVVSNLVFNGKPINAVMRRGLSGANPASFKWSSK